MSDPITRFAGAHSFLSNFSMSQIQMAAGAREIAITVEHAFQAEKMTNATNRARVLACASPGAAKRLARSLPRRDDWENIKRDVMLYYVREKFRNPYLANLLLATGDRYIIEGNTWGDKCWGAVFENGQWVGENCLGLILMQVRVVLK